MTVKKILPNNIYVDIFAKVREKSPLIHHITNAVTMNDCANITISLGASPVMAHAKEEMAEMVSIAGALVLNIGTLDEQQIESMLIAGKTANQNDIPIILDPVGAGATTYRTKTACMLIDQLEIDIIKGNSGEMGTLAGYEATVKGVDSGEVKGNPIEICQNYAEKTGMVVSMSGQIDLISDGRSVLAIENGHPLMGKISGTGCMATSITGGCAAVTKDKLMASACALAISGLAGEKAAIQATGPGTFKTALFDSLADLKPVDLSLGGRVYQVNNV